jgi:predicted nucleic acid-binding protein
MKLLDTTFLIDLLRGEAPALRKLEASEIFLTTQINMFEFIRGLYIQKAPAKELRLAMELFSDIRMLPLDDSGILKSAEISAELYKTGQLIGDNDCLIAGIALSKGVNTIITRNKKHFDRIKGLKVETY